MSGTPHAGFWRRAWAAFQTSAGAGFIHAAMCLVVMVVGFALTTHPLFGVFAIAYAFLGGAYCERGLTSGWKS